jgi:hypothetical protein
VHVCNNIVHDNERQLILTIDGEAFDEELLYFTAIPIEILQGMDNHVPILKWVADDHIHVNKESTIPAKLVVVELFSALLWLHPGLFEEIDSSGGGVLTREDIKARMVKHCGDAGIADLAVDNVMAIADIHGTGTISPLDMMIVHFVATDMVQHVDDEAELAAMKATAAHVLGKDTEHEDVKKMAARIRDKHSCGADLCGHQTFAHFLGLLVLSTIDFDSIGTGVSIGTTPTTKSLNFLNTAPWRGFVAKSVGIQ